MSLLKNVDTSVKENIEQSRQTDLSIGLKNNTTPDFFPKPTRPEELEYILNDTTLNKRTNGFVIEIQDFNTITQNILRYKNQKTLEKNVKNPYDKFKEKTLVIDILPEQFYFKCSERNRFKKLSDLPSSLQNLLESDIKIYESNWREIQNKKKGLDIQTWALKTQSSMGADIIMPFVPFLNKPSTQLLNINNEMNIKLQDAYAISMKEYDSDPSFCYAINYLAFNSKKFTDKLIDSIFGLAELQVERAKERDIQKASMIFMKIYNLNSKLTQNRKNFKKVLSSIPIIRDTFDLNFFFLDCSNLHGQLFLSCGADLFSERTTGRSGITSGDGGIGPGRIYVAEDGYYTNISLKEYKEKFIENGEKPLCKHKYCSKTLKNDIINNNLTNYNKESRRIHHVLSKFDDVNELIKAQKEDKSLRSIKFKIGHSNDSSLNYLNPYH